MALRPSAPTHAARSRAAVWVLVALLLPALLTFGGASSARAADPPAAEFPPTGSVDPASVAAGVPLTFVGVGWTPASLVQASICGENALRGSVNCAAATTGTVAPNGAVTINLTTVVPPSPCPCVVRAAVVMGGPPKDLSIPVEVTGAPYAPLPETVKTPGRLVFIDSGMVGEDSIFTWFGSPVQRRFRIEVGNMGQTAIVNPEFRLGFYQGVYAPTWEDVPTQVTILPGQKKTISLPVELESREFGTFSWRAMYGDQVVDEQALEVGRPWGVYIFAALLVIVIPVAGWRLFIRIVELVGDQRARRSNARDREVGMPGSSAPGPKDRDDNKASAGGSEATPTLAKTSNRWTSTVDADKVDLYKRPLRSMHETTVISGPLYADSEPGVDDHPGTSETRGSV